MNMYVCYRIGLNVASGSQHTRNHNLHLKSAPGAKLSPTQKDAPTASVSTSSKFLTSNVGTDFRKQRSNSTSSSNHSSLSASNTKSTGK